MKHFDFARATQDLASRALNSTEAASAKTEAARLQLPSAVAKLGWRMLKRGDKFDPESCSRALVVGVVPASFKDLEALDQLAERTNLGALVVMVFSFDDCSTDRELNEFVPQANPPTQHPVVAEYLGGRLITFKEGDDVVRWITSSS